MNLKDTLKAIKLNESLISMILGAIVIVIVGILVVNYFRRTDTGTIIPGTTEEGFENQEPQIGGTYIIKEGDTLWSIAESSYGSGYNWVDIADANNLSTSDIEVGQEITIPDVEPKLATNGQTDTSVVDGEVTQTGQTTPSPEATSPTPTPTKVSEGPDAITSSSYTVVKGDNLWNIAIRSYGDGYKWVDIARANNLTNPDLIHPGNVFTLPR